MSRRPPSPTLFPYTTLFPSWTLRRDGEGVPAGADSQTAGQAHGIDQPLCVGERPVVEGREPRRECLRECAQLLVGARAVHADRKSTRLNSSHANISYAVFCL